MRPRTEAADRRIAEVSDALSTTECTRAGGTGLTREQWCRYMPDVPFRPVCGP
ncbi:hypothetical protein [Streptomyces caniscabiei]|uniref:hypothetical protein n=1 Tax=Streptomyces caniscabiei TaxID=2746961 RepID=UPI00131A8A3F|nr:hypothetical protein [Streptomyces caniscabiei]